jgi:hypothetical protein
MCNIPENFIFPQLGAFFGCPAIREEYSAFCQCLGLSGDVEDGQCAGMERMSFTSSACQSHSKCLGQLLHGTAEKAAEIGENEDCSGREYALAIETLTDSRNTLEGSAYLESCDALVCIWNNMTHHMCHQHVTTAVVCENPITTKVNMFLTGNFDSIMANERRQAPVGRAALKASLKTDLDAFFGVTSRNLNIRLGGLNVDFGLPGPVTDAMRAKIAQAASGTGWLNALKALYEQVHGAGAFDRDVRVAITFNDPNAPKTTAEEVACGAGCIAGIVIGVVVAIVIVALIVYFVACRSPKPAANEPTRDHTKV